MRKHHCLAAAALFVAGPLALAQTAGAAPATGHFDLAQMNSPGDGLDPGAAADGNARPATRLRQAAPGPRPTRKTLRARRNDRAR